MQHHTSSYYPKALLTALLFISCVVVSAQNTLQLNIVAKEDDDEESVAAASAHITGTEIAALSDTAGVIILSNIPNGEYTIEISSLGYFKKKVKAVFPAMNGKIFKVYLETQAEEIEEIVVSTTRNYQKPEYLATRVEVITEEEVLERSADKPSDVSHVVREQPGIQVQRTSATAGTLSIRLQGLNSRYAQILKDGFPLFAGFSNVIGITQIPPMDLKQVEIIKGPSSTLYGGDAIAGVINMISRTPAEKPVYDILFNGESANAYDAGFYGAQRIKWFAFSVTGMYRYQYAKDWDGDRFTETPKLHRYGVSPQLYFYIGKHAVVNAGCSYTFENRLGGALPYLLNENDSAYQYFEKNVSEHLSTNFKFEYNFESKGKLTVKNAVNLFDRVLELPYYLFNGTQLATHSEINYRFIRKKHDVVVGIDFRSDDFSEDPDSSTVKRNYTYYTAGVFVQYIYNFNVKTTAEIGMRVDYNQVHKVNALPHLALRHQWNEIFTTRLNAGMGYKLPTIFQEESEQSRYLGVLPVSRSVRPELSVGGTIDLKVKLPNYNGLQVSISQLYFLTHIFRPLQAITGNDTTCNCETINYENGKGYFQTAGVETGITMKYRGLGFSFVYTLTDNNRKIGNVRSIAPLTSKHIIYLLGEYQIKNFSVGIDVYYFSPVKLSDGRTGKGIWEVGVKMQYAYKYFLLFANLENIADIRQTSYGPTVFANPDYNRPRFSEIYAPLEGRLFNMGIKIHLGELAQLRKKGAKGDDD